MKDNESTVFVFIAAIIMGILISMNLNTKPQKEYFTLSTKEYGQNLKKRNILYGEISTLKKENIEVKNKINDYKYSGEKTQKIINDLNGEIRKNEVLDGLSEISGRGIKITIKDASNEFPEYVNDFAFTRVLHDHDMVNIINELKNSGAEAISVNNQRVINNTSTFCSGPFLEINKVNTPAPFYVNAVGDPDIIVQNLNKSDSYISSLINRGLIIEISKEDRIKLPAYIGKPSLKHMKISTN